MKKSCVRLAMIAVVALVMASAPAHAGDWAKLGRTTLVFNNEMGSINVKNDMACNQIMFKVSGKWIEIDTLTITFADGSTQEVELGQAVEGGHESDAIDIDGGAKAIDMIGFTYKPVDRQWTGRTNVTLMGMS